MQSKARFLGHPIHQMLVMFPAGLLGTSVVFDLLYRALDNPQLATVSYWLIAAGIIGGMLAAPFGLIDWLNIPRQTRARAVGALHGLGNVAVLLLFAASLTLRVDAPHAPSWLAHGLAFAGVGLMLVTAWLGGELVDRLGVGLCDEVGLDAPSSLEASHAPRRA